MFVSYVFFIIIFILFSKKTEKLYDLLAKEIRLHIRLVIRMK